MTSSTQTLGANIALEKEELARIIVAEQWTRNPQFNQIYGERGHAKCIEDVTYSLAYLSEAISAGSPRLFEAYIDWTKMLFKGLGIPQEDLAESLTISREILIRRFPDSSDTLASYLNGCVEGFTLNLAESQCLLEDNSNPQGALAREYFDLLRHGHRYESSQLILSAVDQGVGVKDIYLNVFQPCQRESGRLWQANQLSVAEEHYCTAATQLIMAQLSPHIFGTKRIGKSLVATCVGGELHEVGLRMVADFFEMEGWDTYYLGSNMPSSSVVQSLQAQNADLLLISVTMTFNVKLVSQLIAQVRSAALNRNLQILVGGYPFNIEPELWKQTGADGSAGSALEAIDLARGLVAI